MIEIKKVWLRWFDWINIECWCTVLGDGSRPLYLGNKEAIAQSLSSTNNDTSSQQDKAVVELESVSLTLGPR